MTRLLHLLILVLLLLPLRPTAAYAGDKEIFSFAESLYAEQDYYRAITEYKRLLHLHPESAEAPQAALRIAEALIAGERWQEAQVALDRVIAAYPQSTAAQRATLLRPEIAYGQHHFSLASEQFRQLADNSEEPAIREQAGYRLAWSELEQQHFTTAQNQLRQLAAPQAQGLAEALDHRVPPAEKSPGLAGTLSALLPGAGQLYTGNPRDAGLAFALNGTFIWAAVEAFQNDNQVLGGILTFFEIGWYGGNIYNAVNHAHRYNRNLHQQELQRLQQRFGIQLNLGGETTLLQLHGNF